MVTWGSCLKDNLLFIILNFYKAFPVPGTGTISTLLIRIRREPWLWSAVPRPTASSSPGTLLDMPPRWSGQRPCSRAPGDSAACPGWRTIVRDHPLLGKFRSVFFTFLAAKKMLKHTLCNLLYINSWVSYSRYKTTIWKDIPPRRSFCISLPRPLDNSWTRECLNAVNVLEGPFLV